MTTPNFSAPTCDTPNSLVQTPDSVAVSPAKAPYETPQLTNYGRLRHLTLQNISGGGDGGGTG